MSFNLNDITNALVNSSESGVSFQGKALKWENAEQVVELIKAMDSCEKLDFLNLEGNTLGVQAADAIGEALKKHPEFQKAYFKDLFTGRMKTEIPKALESMGNGMIAAKANLVVLDCSDNALGPNGMVGLVNLLKSPTCYSLQDLRLNNCGLGITGGKMLAQALLDCHKESVKAYKPLSLKTFIAGRNRLENDGATALAKVFAACKTLEEIAMPQNGIYHVGISALSEAFKQNINLRVINLNDNTIGPKGAEALSEAFYSMQKLRELNFGDCLLKTKGAIYMANALQDEHKELEVLNFGFNEISADGGVSIAAAVENKQNLISLILDGNQFGSEGRAQIEGVLTDCNKLEALGTMDEDDSDGEGDDEDDDASDDDTEDADSDATEEGAANLSELNKSNTIVVEDEDNTLVSNTSLTQEDFPENSIEAFCITPSPTEKMFFALSETDKITAFQNFFKSVPQENYLIYVAFTILKCAELSTKSEEALKITEQLFQDVFQFGKVNNRLKSIRNFFLVQLRLMKCEESKFKPVYDVESCRFALQNAINKDLIPEEEKNIFKVFLENNKSTNI